MANRLAQSTSPYLLQHQDNPVDWRPWGEEAFAEARQRDVPVLVSIGYAACHWCHVMAHESFEDPITAQLMNEQFVNIKVDREERPDVDAVYMEATQAMTGQGGWPMTVFCTPSGEPFYCGTYFPPRPRPGMPAFRKVLASISQAWQERRTEVTGVGAEVVRRLSQRSTALDAARPPTPEDLDRAVRLLARDFDSTYAGFGGAPKFPPSMTLEQLLRHHARTGGAHALRMVEATCEAMARGGMYDQLGGGFARYSIDARWVVPHFEKMLYDNALLLRAYVHLWRTTGAPLARRVATETADWMLRDLRTPEGGFASALDADSEGVEGKFYSWTPDQLREALGPEDAAYAGRIFGVTATGTFEHGSSVLQLREDPQDPQRYAAVRAALLDARNRRVPPARDDKVVAAWNGLAISALAEAGTLLDRPDLVDAARETAQLLVDVHLADVHLADVHLAGVPVADGRLLRTSRDGKRGPNAGVLEDYGDVAEGFLTLYAVTGEPEWLRRAGDLLDTVLAHFSDGSGGFYDTADDAEKLVRRPQDPGDNATPSGQSAVAGALLSYAAYTGSVRHRDAAEGALGVAAVLGRRSPRAVGWGLAVAEALADGPREVAVMGPPDDEATRMLRRTAFLGTAPGAVIAVGDPARPVEVALLRDRPLMNGRPAAYVCRGFVCELPTTDPERLAEQLGAPLAAGS